MKNIGILALSLILLTGFVFAANGNQGLMSGQDENISGQGEMVQAGEISEFQAKVVKREQNRLMIHNISGNCPSDCTCTGSTTKCDLEEGRQMTIQAGQSGNIIVQMKGINTSTNVSLYKSEGKYYGEFRGNETKQVNFLPDQAGERLRQRLNLTECNCSMNLTEDGEYQVEAQQRVRVLGMFQVNQKTQAQVNAFDGSVAEVKRPWWSFMVTSEVEETQ